MQVYLNINFLEVSFAGFAKLLSRIIISICLMEGPPRTGGTGVEGMAVIETGLKVIINGVASLRK